jgi:hypothetical protein
MFLLPCSAIVETNPAKLYGIIEYQVKTNQNIYYLNFFLTTRPVSFYS